MILSKTVQHIISKTLFSDDMFMQREAKRDHDDYIALSLDKKYRIQIQAAKSKIL